MASLYKSIQGWFDYEDFYDFVLSKYNSGVFVEIGIWKGKSVIYLAERVKEQNKNIKIFAIDTFNGTPGESQMSNQEELSNLFDTYLQNIKPVQEFIKTIRGDSIKVHVDFPDQSIDFLFIDGNHEYDAVKKDLENWVPKVKTGGIIAGHDYVREGNCGVVDAVNEFFGAVNTFGSRVWYTIK